MTLLPLLVAAALLAACPVWAQPQGAFAEAQARELYKKGMIRYELGEFDAAIEAFKAAYELTNAPGLLFNLAQINRMKQDWVQALHFYRTYLRLQPSAPNRTDVDALIVEVQRALDEKERANRQLLEAPAAPPAKLEPPVVPIPSIITRPPPPWRAKLGVGVAAVLIGVSAVAGGIVLGLRAADDAAVLARDSSTGTSAWDVSRQVLYSDGQRAATAGIALDVVGAVLTVSGVVVGAVGLSERAQARRLSFIPSVRGSVLACDF
jgi:tetratricopeptide (TPR) repeat protein